MAVIINFPIKLSLRILLLLMRHCLQSTGNGMTQYYVLHRTLKFYSRLSLLKSLFVLHPCSLKEKRKEKKKEKTAVYKPNRFHFTSGLSRKV